LKDVFGSDSQAIYHNDMNVWSIETIGNNILKELARVLKNGGKVIVLEESSPADVGGLKRRFENCGFKLTEENIKEDTYKVYDPSLKLKFLLGTEAYSLVFVKP
jgi:SAM-dependent methyltransferase